MTRTYTLIDMSEHSQIIDRFDAYTLACNALGRAITERANHLRALGSKKAEALEKARSHFRLDTEAE